MSAATLLDEAMVEYDQARRRRLADQVRALNEHYEALAEAIREAIAGG